jgi:hypothetical protein
VDSRVCEKVEMRVLNIFFYNGGWWKQRGESCYVIFGQTRSGGRLYVSD